MAEAFLTIVGLLFMLGSISIFISMVVDKHHYRPLPIPNGDRSDFAIAGEVLRDSFDDVDIDAAFTMEDD
jgi:hypothetical protein